MCGLLSPIGLLLFLMCFSSQKELEKKRTKQCPYCAERVNIGAKVCKHCGHSVASIICPSCKTRLFKPEGAIPGQKIPCSKCFKAIRIS